MDISQDVALLRMRHNKLPRSLTNKTGNGQMEKDKFNRELRKAADGFEELFVHKMLQIMRQSVQKSGLMDGGRGEEIFQDMLDENYAKAITQRRAFGLSDLIYEQTKR